MLYQLKINLIIRDFILKFGINYLVVRTRETNVFVLNVKENKDNEHMKNLKKLKSQIIVFY
jgi:hypothetical protein